MTNVPARTLDFYDRHVVTLIVEKYNLAELDALQKFINSETYTMLRSPELDLYGVSPYFIFDMWEAEMISGDPRNSIYIRGN
ncbi:MAG: hypothetical protein LBT37_03395 [Lactobacillaceae bacterium]|jgi:hypothetical protein|nr:hypothetical protein [Lactobacillaceae bacterium]